MSRECLAISLTHLVADFYGFTYERLMHRQRGAELDEARMVVMFCCREFLFFSQEAAGAVLGRTHGAAANAERVIGSRVECDRMFMRRWPRLRAQIVARLESKGVAV